MKFSNLKQLGFAIALVAIASNTARAEFDAAKFDKLDKEAGSGFFDEAFSYVGITSWNRTSAQNRMRDAMDSAKVYRKHAGSDASKYSPEFAQAINELEKLGKDVNQAYGQGANSATYKALRARAEILNSRMILLADEAKKDAEVREEQARKLISHDAITKMRDAQAAYLAKAARDTDAKHKAGNAEKLLEEKRKDIGKLVERKEYLASMTQEQRDAAAKVNAKVARLEDKINDQHMANLREFKAKCFTPGEIYMQISDCSAARDRLKEQLVEIEAAKAEINAQVDAWLKIGAPKCDSSKKDLLGICKPESDSERAARRKEMEEFLGMKRHAESTALAKRVLKGIDFNERRSKQQNEEWERILKMYEDETKSDIADIEKDRGQLNVLFGQIVDEKEVLARSIQARKAEEARLLTEATELRERQWSTAKELEDSIPGLVDALTNFHELARKNLIDYNVSSEFLAIKGSIPAEIVAKSGPHPAPKPTRGGTPGK